MQEKITLTFSVPYEQRTLFDRAIEKFKDQEPNITIEIKSLAYTYPDGDITLVPWYVIYYGQSELPDQALDLNPLIQQDSSFSRSDYFPGVFETFSVSGKLLALPAGIDPFVVLYNQDLFDKMGVAYPKATWIWDDFRTTAVQLTDTSAGIYGYLPADGYIDCTFFTYQNGGMLLDKEGHAHLDSPEAVNTVEWYAKLFGENGAAPTSQQIRKAYGEGGGLAGISQGKVGMWIDTVSNLKGTGGIRWKFRVGINPLPRGEQSFTLAQLQGLMIKSDTANPQAAWRWVTFLTSQPMPELYPARKSVADSAVYMEMVGKEQARSARAAIDQSTLITALDFNRFQSVLSSFSYAISQVIEKGIPASEALQKAQQSAEVK